MYIPFEFSTLLIIILLNSGILTLLMSAVATSRPKINGPRLIMSTAYPEWKRLKFYKHTALHPAFQGDKGDHRWSFDPWQSNDIRFVIDPRHKEIMFLRNRGGSKTRDGTVLAVWFAFQKNPSGAFNDVIWYAGSEDQLTQAKKYFGQNRYVKKVTGKFILLKNNNKIMIKIATEKQAKSARSDVLFLDEEQDFKKEIYQYIIGTGVGRGRKIIHMGTTQLDTVLHTNFNELEPMGMVREHHVDECSWTTVEKELERYRGMPDFVIQSQLFCKWVRPEGFVFENVEVRELTPEEKDLILPMKYLGVDPNPKSGHALVYIRYIGTSYEEPDAIYVAQEVGSKQLEKMASGLNAGKDDSELLAEWIWKRLHHDVICEVEAQGGGYEFMKTFDRISQGMYEGDISELEWNEKSKLDRIFGIRPFKIIIHPRCKETKTHIKSAGWNPNEPRPKLMKTADQHFLDGFIHACQASSAIEITAY